LTRIQLPKGTHRQTSETVRRTTNRTSHRCRLSLHQRSPITLSGHVFVEKSLLLNTDLQHHNCWFCTLQAQRRWVIDCHARTNQARGGLGILTGSGCPSFSRVHEDYLPIFEYTVTEVLNPHVVLKSKQTHSGSGPSRHRENRHSREWVVRVVALADVMFWLTPSRPMFTLL
jgi:hypothetical protein